MQPAAEKLCSKSSQTDSAGYRVNISNLMLQDESAEVRTLAAYALDRLGADAATPALLRALSDPCFSVRSAAGWALVEVCADAPENVQSVLEASCDPYAREMAKLVLERLPKPPPSATRGNTIKTKLEAEGSAANLDDLSPNHLLSGPDSDESELEKVRSQLLLHLEYEHDMRNAVGRVALALHRTPQDVAHQRTVGSSYGHISQLRVPAGPLR